MASKPINIRWIRSGFSHTEKSCNVSYNIRLYIVFFTNIKMYNHNISNSFVSRALGILRIHFSIHGKLTINNYNNLLQIFQSFPGPSLPGGWVEDPAGLLLLHSGRPKAPSPRHDCVRLFAPEPAIKYIIKRLFSVLHPKRWWEMLQ